MPPRVVLYRLGASAWMVYTAVVYTRMQSSERLRVRTLCIRVSSACVKPLLKLTYAVDNALECIGDRYMAAAEALGESRAGLWEMAHSSIDHIFACNAVKQSLRLEVEAGKAELLASTL